MTATLISFPVIADAHGEQVLAYPVSAFLAFGIGVPLIVRLKDVAWIKWAAVLVMFLTVSAIWEWIRFEPADLPIYTLFFTVLPLATAFASIWMIRAWQRRL